jgi:hypothetical protein
MTGCTMHCWKSETGAAAPAARRSLTVRYFIKPLKQICVTVCPSMLLFEEQRKPLLVGCTNAIRARGLSGNSASQAAHHCQLVSHRRI